MPVSHPLPSWNKDGRQATATKRGQWKWKNLARTLTSQARLDPASEHNSSACRKKKCLFFLQQSPIKWAIRKLWHRYPVYLNYLSGFRYTSVLPPFELCTSSNRFYDPLSCLKQKKNSINVNDLAFHSNHYHKSWMEYGSNTVGFLPNSFGRTSGGICLLLAPSQNKHGAFTTHYMLKECLCQLFPYPEWFSHVCNTTYFLSWMKQRKY